MLLGQQQPKKREQKKEEKSKKKKEKKLSTSNRVHLGKTQHNHSPYLMSGTVIELSAMFVDRITCKEWDNQKRE